MTISTAMRIAHRGMPRLARENTIASFEMAMAADADGIELDVHATSDGRIVVHHDPTLSDGLAIRSSTWDELHARDEAVPTLDAVLSLVGNRVELFVELKGLCIEAEVLQLLARHRGPYAIHSFDHDMIRRASALPHTCPLGILIDDALADVGSLMSTCLARDVWPHYEIAHEQLVHTVHASGGRVIPWTVNDPVDARRLGGLGVEGICTDDVRILETLR